MTYKTVLIAFVVILAGCEDKYQNGYAKGYADGVLATEQKLKEIIVNKQV